MERKAELWQDLSICLNELEVSSLGMQECEHIVMAEKHSELKRTIHMFRNCMSYLHLLSCESDLLKAMINHDFLNRFATINLRLDILSRKPSIDKVDQVCNCIWIFRQVIGSLVFWVDRLPIELDRVSINEYLVETTKHLKSYFSQVDISCRMDKKNIFVLIHQPIVTNFIINLIVNAQKHGAASKIELLLSIDHDKAVVSIRDDGKGMDSSFNEHRSGLGLLMIDERLAIMNAVLKVDEHGGIDGGAAFHIEFPIAEKQVDDRL